MANAISRKAELDSLAGRLATAWLRGGRLETLSDRECPDSRPEAYFVSDRMAEEISEDLSGWKVGATSRKMRELDGHNDVIPGRIFQSVTWRGEESILPADRFPSARAEAEFAFRLKYDVTEEMIDDPQRMAAAVVLHPAIELIGNRFDPEGLTQEKRSLMTIADNGGGIGFVFGSAIEDWQGFDFQSHHVRVSIDGNPPSENFLGEMRGEPLQALCDLARHLQSRGYFLSAGDFVSTGAACVPQSFGKGSLVVADFGELGRISARFE